MRWLFPLFLNVGGFALVDLLQRAALAPTQWGILLLDGGLVLAVVWLLCRYFQAFVNAPRIATLLTAVLVVGVMIGWRSAPDALPAERALQYHLVEFLQAEERQHCRSIWAIEVQRCEPQVLLRSTDQREWKLAFADRGLHFRPTAVATGQWLRLGVYEGKVYSATRQEIPQEQVASNCSYRQNPLARRTQVTWVCGDAPRGVAKTFSEELAAQHKNAPAYTLPDPLLFADSARSHQALLAAYHQKIKSIFWPVLDGFR